MKNSALNWKTWATRILFAWLSWASLSLLRLQNEMSVVLYKLKITAQDYEAMNRHPDEEKHPKLADPELFHYSEEKK